MEAVMSVHEVELIISKTLNSATIKDEIHSVLKENGLTVIQAVAMLESAKADLFKRKVS